jgi:hypothetical protein
MEETRICSRRVLLGGAAGGLAALTGQALARIPLARADDGDPVTLGQTNTADNTTRIEAHEVALWGVSSTDDGALVGENNGNDGYAVRGSGLYIGGNFVGGAYGVTADSTYGVGLKASTYSGTAIVAEGRFPEEGGVAIKVLGRARFSRSGRVIVPRGWSSATVMGIPLTEESLVLATVQLGSAATSSENFVTSVAVDVDSDSFTVRLRKAAKDDTTVAWFVAN